MTQSCLNLCDTSIHHPVFNVCNPTALIPPMAIQLPRTPLAYLTNKTATFPNTVTHDPILLLSTSVIESKNGSIMP